MALLGRNTADMKRILREFLQSDELFDKYF
jgi:hypothetical protein